MQRVIFADIDGVINSRYFLKSKLRSYFYHEDDSKYGMSTMISRYNLFWLGLLCRIMRAKVVLSSSWRYGWNEDGTVNLNKSGHQMITTDKLFRKFGVNVIGITKRKEPIQLQKSYKYNEDILNNFISRQHCSGLGNICSSREEVLKYARGTQILDWLEQHNFSGSYIVLEDDFEDVCFYKLLEERIVITKFYKRFGGFRFKDFIKAICLFKRQEKNM